MFRKSIVLLVICGLLLGAGVILAKEQVKLTATFAAPKDRWDMLMEVAEEIINERHPDMDIEISYEVLPYAQARSKLITMTAGKTPRDLVSVDQIWLGEFAKAGYLKDITFEVAKWGRIDEFYPKNVEGCIYDGRFYGLWSWTDVRVLWYWKDLLNEAGVEPEDLTTWDGYVEAYEKLKPVTMSKGIQPIHLVGAGHSPDMWFPYLWMCGGDILELRKDQYGTEKYFPVFDSDAGVKALGFLQDQVEAGIKPQIDHYWGAEFADKKFAVMLEGSWLLGNFPDDFDFSKIGMLPLFPTPEEDMTSSTMMGGWMLAIPSTSEHPELAWELLTILEDPDVLTPMLAEFGYLPTQKTIAEDPEYASVLEEKIPFFNEMVKALPIGHGRPNIPQYPTIAENIRMAIEEVYYGRKDPEAALEDAAEKSKSVLGW